MVPGMTERDRLAADVHRLAWLADATLGPARIGTAAQGPPKMNVPCPAMPIGIWRRGLSSARILGQRIRLLKPAPGEALPRRASAPVR